MPVYMIQAGDGGAVKIGYSHSPIKRLAALQTSNQTSLQIMRVLDGGTDIEALLHQRFSHLHVVGEWFRFAPEMLSELGCVDLPIPMAARRTIATTGRSGRPPSEPLIPVHVRLSPEVYAEVKALAASAKRPLAYFLRKIVEDDAERHEAATRLAESPA